MSPGNDMQDMTRCHDVSSTCMVNLDEPTEQTGSQHEDEPGSLAKQASDTGTASHNFAKADTLESIVSFDLSVHDNDAIKIRFCSDDEKTLLRLVRAGKVDPNIVFHTYQLSFGQIEKDFTVGTPLTVHSQPWLRSTLI